MRCRSEVCGEGLRRFDDTVGQGFNELSIFSKTFGRRLRPYTLASMALHVLFGIPTSLEAPIIDPIGLVLGCPLRCSYYINADQDK